MDVREKLVELIAQKVCDTWSESCDEWLPHDYGKCYANDCLISEIADYLISNGVTVQEWISVKDRLPTIYDADADNCVLAIHKSGNKRYYHWRSVANNPFDFTHWMKTPQPPKGE